MNRRTPLSRYTPLRATAALARKTGLRAVTPLEAKSAPKGSAAPRKPRGAEAASQAHPFPPAASALIDARDISLLTGERCCQMCAATENLDRHHRRLKGMGGSEHRAHAQCACNGVTLCRRCHRWAHGPDRLSAEAMGFIVSQSAREPAAKGVMRFALAEGGATQWPSCDGRWLDAAEMGEEAA